LLGQLVVDGGGGDLLHDVVAGDDLAMEPWHLGGCGNARDAAATARRRRGSEVSNSSTSSSFRKDARFRSEGQGSAPGAATQHRSSAHGRLY
jgi:hypothetical protein